MLIGDENDLRAGLRALSATAPPQPAERVAASVGRARRLRRRRAALAVAAALLPAVAVGAALTRPGPPPADYTNVVSWPDRRDPALAEIERNVLAEWELSNDVPDGESVRWLYSGRVAAADAVVVAFATCGPADCSRTVLAYGSEAKMAKPPKDDSETPWLYEATDVVAGRPAGALSAYLRSAARPEDGPTTVLFVLAAPDATTVTYLAPNRAGTGSTSGSVPRSGSAFVADVGYLEADATITVMRADGSFAHQGTVASDDSHGYARQLDGIDLPPGYERSSAESGQLGSSPTATVDMATGPEPHALFVRCVGAQPVRARLNGVTKAVPCDGGTHRVTQPLAPVPTTFPDEAGTDRDELAFEYSVEGADPYTVFVAALAKPV